MGKPLTDDDGSDEDALDREVLYYFQMEATRNVSADKMTGAQRALASMKASLAMANDRSRRAKRKPGDA